MYSAYSGEVCEKRPQASGYELRQVANHCNAKNVHQMTGQKKYLLQLGNFSALRRKRPCFRLTSSMTSMHGIGDSGAFYGNPRWENTAGVSSTKCHPCSPTLSVTKCTLRLEIFKALCYPETMLIVSEATFIEIQLRRSQLPHPSLRFRHQALNAWRWCPPQEVWFAIAYS